MENAIGSTSEKYASSACRFSLREDMVHPKKFAKPWTPARRAFR
jgi:hypothetical protein